MPTQHFHVAIWIDYREARIFHFNTTDAVHITLHSNNLSLLMHDEANTICHGHETLNQAFLQEIATAVARADEVLIIGKDPPRAELAKHIRRYHGQLNAKILNHETVEHPSDELIITFARNLFGSADSMRPQ